MTTIPRIRTTDRRDVPVIAVPFRTIRAGQTFRDEASMWHVAGEDVTVTSYRGRPILTVETMTGRRLYADVETIVPIR